MDTTTPPPVPGQTTFHDCPLPADAVRPLDMQMHRYAAALHEIAYRLDMAVDELADPPEGV